MYSTHNMLHKYWNLCQQLIHSLTCSVSFNKRVSLGGDFTFETAVALMWTGEVDPNPV